MKTLGMMCAASLLIAVVGYGSAYAALVKRGMPVLSARYVTGLPCYRVPGKLISQRTMVRFFSPAHRVDRTFVRPSYWEHPRYQSLQPKWYVWKANR